LWSPKEEFKLAFITGVDNLLVWQFGNWKPKKYLLYTPKLCVSYTTIDWCPA